MSPRFGGANGSSPLKQSEKKVSGFENEALRFIPTNEDVMKTEGGEDVGREREEDEHTRI